MSATQNTRLGTASVLITGANRNIGAYMARRFLESGYRVVAQYRSHTDEIDALEAAGALLVQGELGAAHATLDVAERVLRAAPRLRAIIHNASAFAPTADDARDAAAQFQAFFAVHMLAPYLLNTALADHLDPGSDAAADIIHIADIYADNLAPEYDIYCATKAGLQNLALAFAKRLAPRIKVNAIQPGPISFEPWQNEDSRDRILTSTPLRRAGSPEAIYTAIRAIMANDYQTGAVIPVDGGRRLGRS